MCAGMYGRYVIITSFIHEDNDTHMSEHEGWGLSRASLVYVCVLCCAVAVAVAVLCYARLCYGVCVRVCTCEFRCMHVCVCTCVARMC